MGGSIRTIDPVLELLDASVPSAALGAALELGLFWPLADTAMSADAIANALSIPARRCEIWLEILRRSGLLVSIDGRYLPSAAARAGILERHSRETWGLLAQEAREGREELCDLPAALVDARRRAQPATYVSRMRSDPVRARRFTRMLYELHQSLAARLARAIDLRDVRCMLDLGGGSGVVSIALARSNPGLSLAVLDIPTVCDAGREIAADEGMTDRVAFLAGDFLQGELPGGFDAILECDVGVYEHDLFARVRRALPPGGRFVIADQVAPDAGGLRPHLEWELLRSLRNPEFAPVTVELIVGRLRSTGFGDVRVTSLPIDESSGFVSQTSLIEARALA